MTDGIVAIGCASAWTAFERADRACRTRDIPAADAYLARAAALARLGFRPEATADLDRAFRLGANDPSVLEAVLATHPDPERREAAARLLVANDRAGDAAVGAAVAFLFARGTEILLHGRRVGRRVAGWVTTGTGVAPSLRLRRDDGQIGILRLREGEPAAAPEAPRRWTFDAPADADGPVALDAALPSGRSVSLALHAPPLAVPPARRPVPASPAASDPGVTVVVPIYGDPDSLSACLDALRRQRVGGLAVVLVDDASPDPEVQRLGRAFCRDGDGIYRRNALNAGFAASVNLGLSLVPEGDVLVLNSDVVLPEGAVARLRQAARSSPEIGIAAPFSNDAGNTTFPDPMAPGPPLPASQAAAVDAAARRVNAGVTVDLPSVLGSCLFLTRACLDGVGPLSLAYGRGYFEDVDLCLRARERGFRVVAACDTYVSHVSGRSFGTDRYALIIRNMPVLDARFPGHAAVDAANDRADPLRSARAAIEEALTPTADPCVILLGRAAGTGAAVAHRAGALAGEAVAVFRMEWRVVAGGVELLLSSDIAGGPRSLAFALDPDGRARLARYLARLRLLRIEVFEPDALPEPLWRWLAGVGPPLTLVVDGDAAAAAALDRRARRTEDGRAPWAGAALLASDRMAAACLPGSPAPAAPRRGIARTGRPVARLGVVMTALCPRAERLVLSLARHLGRHLVLLGRCSDDARMMAAGDVWVTGRMAVGELPAALARYGLDGLLLPYRGAFHWIVEALWRTALPHAYFDWSPHGLPVAPGDLALDPAADDAAVCDRILAWTGAAPAACAP